LVTVTWNAAFRSWDVTPTVVYEADPNARFDLDWSNSVFGDNDTTVAVNPATGLLQALNAGSPGQNVNSVGTLVGTAPNVVHLGSSIAAVRSYDGAAFTAEQFDAFSQQMPGSIAPQGASYAGTAQIIVNDDDRTERIALVASPEVEGSTGLRSGTAEAGMVNSRPPRIYAAVRVMLTFVGQNFRSGPRNPPGGSGGRDRGALLIGFFRSEI
jgi:hypothetical protein